MQAILFDLEGVLVKEDYKRKSYSGAFKKLDIVVNPELFGEGVYERPERVNEILKIYNSNITYKEFSEIEQKIQQSVIQSEGITQMPFAREALEVLHDVGYKLVLTSGSRYAESILLLAGLRGYFEFIVQAEKLINHKPHPDVYKNALANCSLNGNDCIAIEDTPKGIQSAKVAGVSYCILFRLPHYPPPKKFEIRPDFTAHSLERVVIHILQVDCKIKLKNRLYI